MSAQRSWPDLDPPQPLHRLTVEQYEAMSRAGILLPDDRVELLEGLLVEKMTKNPPHRVATRRTRVALESVVKSDFYVDTQEPIVTGDSEPEPDVCIVRGSTEDYLEANPPASQVAMVVEIAEDSLLHDRRVKARIYARAGIPAYWIVNLVDRKLEVHSDPTGATASPEYRKRAELGEHDSVDVIVAGSLVGRIAVRSLLP